VWEVTSTCCTRERETETEWVRLVIRSEEDMLCDSIGSAGEGMDVSETAVGSLK